MDTNTTYICEADGDSRLCDCFFDSQSFIDSMNAKQYDDAFQRYKSACEPIVCAIDKGLIEDCMPSPEIMAKQLADKITDGWKAELAQNPKLKQRTLETRDRMFLALYMIPMLQETGAASAMTLCEAVRDEWVKRYPKTPIVIGRYADIAAGFRKKAFGMCFITTAVCEFDGKPDNCAELTALRRFRDEYMMKTEEGQALVEQYYDIAPKLVTAIDFCSDRRSVYGDLRDNYIDPCLDMIASGNLPACQSRYCDMVNHLRSEFCI